MQFFNSIIPALALCTLIVACSDKDAPDASDMSGLEQPSQSTMASVDDLDFELERPDDPGFVEGIDLSDVPGYNPGVSSQSYIEKDGYVYKVDPATLEPVGGPLDPITHEPVDVGAAESGPVSTPSAVKPTEENKYPNTGVFSEDD